MPSAEDYFVRGVTAAELGRVDEAERWLRRSIARGTSRAEPRLLLAKLAAGQERWPTVAAALEPVADSDPNGYLARVAEGDAWDKLDFARRAEDCWSRAHGLDPAAELARRRLLFLYAIQLRRGPWMRLLWEAYDADQAGLREMLQLMIADYSVWEVAAPMQRLHEFLSADPADAPSRRGLGVYLLSAGRLSEARPHLEQAWHEQPNDIEFWAPLVDCLLRLSDADAVDKLLRAAPREFLADPRVIKSLGNRELLHSDFPEAVRLFRQAIQTNVYDMELHHKLARALRLVGEEEEAERHANVARTLAETERACLTLNSGEWALAPIQAIVTRCIRLRLVEEGIGWARVGLSQAPGDDSLRQALGQLASMTRTSRRNPPGLNELW